MRIGILGTGAVSQTLAGKLAELDHDVMVGTRDVSRTMANREPNQYGMPAFSVWHEQHPAVKVGSFEEAARHGEVVMNANQRDGIAGGPGAGRRSQSGSQDPDRYLQLAGLFARDAADPLGVQHRLAGRADSARLSARQSGQDAQHGDGRADGQPALADDGNHHIFVSGNDAEAKAQVSEWLRTWFGWRHILDLGDITSVRGAETHLPLWLRLFGRVSAAPWSTSRWSAPEGD